VARFRATAFRTLVGSISVDIAQRLERPAVARKVAGSNPVIHPLCCNPDFSIRWGENQVLNRSASAVSDRLLPQPDIDGRPIHKGKGAIPWPGGAGSKSRLLIPPTF
jgi:hypothetical protein